MVFSEETLDCTIGDIAARIRHALVGGPFGSDLGTADYTPSGVPVIRGQNLSVGKYVGGEFVYVSDAKATKLSANLARPGDLVFTQRGNAVLHGGQVAIVPKVPFERYVVSQSQMKLSPDLAKVDPEFLYLVFTSGDYRHYLRSNAIVTGVPHINLGLLRSYPVSLPPLAEQKDIAAIIGALDDKIELNRRMNATLEAIARALFQSWFVDFDPVRAKLDGRPSPAAPFPASFQDSEAGHIPKDWTVGKVSDVATLNRGAVNPGDFPTEIFDHFSLPAFDNGRNPKVELGSAIMSNKFTVTPNSVLLSKLNPHIPRIWLPDLHASRRSVCSTEFMVACSKPGVSREYLFSLFASSSFASIYGTLVTGTTGSHQRIRPESVLDMKIIIPSAALIRAFTDIAKPMFDRINRNTEQSRTLATLRDTLLPKLLSGEISLRDSENQNDTF